MTETQDFAGYATLGMLTAKPVSPILHKRTTRQSPQARKMTRKMDQSGTQEAILKHTNSQLNRLK